MTDRSKFRGGKLRCVICGSSADVELHHLGGRNHIVWIVVPLCRPHHVRLTEQLRIAGVDMRFTPNVYERLARARKATLIFHWMLEEMLEQQIKKGTTQ